MKNTTAALFVSLLATAAIALSACAVSVDSQDGGETSPSVENPGDAPTTDGTFPGGLDDDGLDPAELEWCHLLVESNYENNAASLSAEGVRQELEHLKAAAPDDLKDAFQTLIDEQPSSWEDTSPESQEAIEAITLARAECLSIVYP